METYEFMRVVGERTSKIDKVYHDCAKSHVISYNVLAVLYTAYKNENCSQKYICEEWYVPKQTVNTICKDLIKLGIITQVHNPEDRRQACISLTKKGKELAEPIVSELLEIESRVLARMGNSDTLQLLKLYCDFVESIEIEFEDSERNDIINEK